MTDFREDMLTAILDCGYGDLYLLEDCRYDIGEIVDECQFTFGKLDINDMVRIMFEFGLRDIEYDIRSRIEDLNDIEQTEGELDESEKEERDALSMLNPSEDIESFHNYVDTHIWIEAKDKVETYERYLKSSLDQFEEMTGFAIQY